MGRLPQISGQKLIRALIRVGFQVVDQEGSHAKLRRKRGRFVETIIVPDHKTVRPGTLHSILRLAGMTPEDLKELL